MDRLSELPEALLLKILSSLPAKDVVATMVLSKRWQFLWTFVPKLLYNDQNVVEYGRFSRFVDRSLLLHKAPILQTLHFKVSETCVGDIPVWTRARSVRELIIEIKCSSTLNPPILTRSLYTGCTMLVTLKLNNVVLVDYSSPSFPSLKILRLESVKYPGDEFVKMFLSNCNILECLTVCQCPGDNVTVFTVRVPSLKRLYVYRSPKSVANDADGYVIDTPSLNFLAISDYTGGFCVVEKEIPNIEEADIEAAYWSVSKILGSITSLKRLSLCLQFSKDVYPVGSVFHCLEHLRVCTCESEWLNMLMCLLKVAPKLKSLELEQYHDPPLNESRPCWNEPSSVPKCLLLSLETLKWITYEGTEEEKQVVAFILRNGSCLKNVTIYSESTDRDRKLEMLKELSKLFRCSPTCSLAFD